jgi:flavin reductase (DIM6/NTAB) family NADH-FMN oxidoreductase RutF
METWQIGELADWPRIRRANFINSLSGFKSVSLVGTKSSSGITNLAVFSNIVHLGADPALIGIVNRPREATPHTLSNIEQTGYFTINHLHPGILESGHQCSAKYPDGVSEFEACGLTPVYDQGIPAPYVAESTLRYGLRLEEILPIRKNNTWFIVGSIQTIHFDPAILQEDGYLSIDEAGSLTSLGLDGYYQPKFLRRLPYARPSRP